MPEGFAGGYQIANVLLEVFDFRETAGRFPVENFFVIQKYLKRPGYFGRAEGYFAQFVGKRCQQFLRQPGRAE